MRAARAARQPSLSAALLAYRPWPLRALPPPQVPAAGRDNVGVGDLASRRRWQVTATALDAPAHSLAGCEWQSAVPDPGRARGCGPAAAGSNPRLRAHPATRQGPGGARRRTHPYTRRRASAQGRAAEFNRGGGPSARRAHMRGAGGREDRSAGQRGTASWHCSAPELRTAHGRGARQGRREPCESAVCGAVWGPAAGGGTLLNSASAVRGSSFAAPC